MTSRKLSRKSRPGKKTSVQETSGEILFGFHSVSEAFAAKKREIHTVYVSEKRSDQRIEQVVGLARKRNIPVAECPAEQLLTMTDSRMHQGLAAHVGKFPVRPGMEVFSLVSEQALPCFFLVLESIEDPHNLGALIRTAVCAGVDAILIPKNRSALPTPTVSRTSAGAMEHANIFLMTNTASVLRELKEKGVWIMGLDAHGTSSLYEVDMTLPLALVVGGEHKGLRPVVHKQCHEILSIPMKGSVNSLNASVAGGIALFEAVRQRAFQVALG